MVSASVDELTENRGAERGGREVVDRKGGGEGRERTVNDTTDNNLLQKSKAFCTDGSLKKMEVKSV